MSLEKFAFDGSEIRCTAAGQPSVFDMIRVLGGKKNPHDTWKRITEQYPDTLGKCESVVLPDSLGRKGRTATPVAKDKEAALYILGLLPGVAGRTYRDEAARLFVRYLDGDTTLAEEVIRRSDNIEGIKRVAEVATSRTKYLTSYHGLHDALKERECERKHHAVVNKVNNELVGIAPGARKTMTDRDALMLQFLQAGEQLALMDAPPEIKKWKAVDLCKSRGIAAIQLLKSG